MFSFTFLLMIVNLVLQLVLVLLLLFSVHSKLLLKHTQTKNQYNVHILVYNYIVQDLLLCSPLCRFHQPYRMFAHMSYHKLLAVHYIYKDNSSRAHSFHCNHERILCHKCTYAFQKVDTV